MLYFHSAGHWEKWHFETVFLWEDRDLNRNIAAVAIPIALHNLFNFGVSMRDTLMLGVLRGRRILACPAGAGRLHPPQV